MTLPTDLLLRNLCSDRSAFLCSVWALHQTVCLRFQIKILCSSRNISVQCFYIQSQRQMTETMQRSNWNLALEVKEEDVNLKTSPWVPNGVESRFIKAFTHNSRGLLSRNVVFLWQTWGIKTDSNFDLKSSQRSTPPSCPDEQTRRSLHQPVYHPNHLLWGGGL